MDEWSRRVAVRRLAAGLSLAISLVLATLDETHGQDATSAGGGETQASAKRSAASSKLKRGAKSAAASPAAAGGETSGARAAEDDGTGDPFQSAIDSEKPKPKTEVATFGAGCFWHVEAEFEWLPGVKSAVSGYSGGSLTNPTYEDVHEGWTGHAEVVRVEYDPAVISYEQLLKVFWSGHDPTQLNRQGPDFGTQYRSVIFYHSPEQRKSALKSYEELTRARVYRAPIVTQLVPAQVFYPAEEYHQNYYGGKDGRALLKRRSKATKKPAARASATDSKKGKTGGTADGKSP